MKLKLKNLFIVYIMNHKFNLNDAKLNKKLEKELSFLVKQVRINREKTKNMKNLEKKVIKLKNEQQELLEQLQNLSKMLV